MRAGYIQYLFNIQCASATSQPTTSEKRCVSWQTDLEIEFFLTSSEPVFFHNRRHIQFFMQCGHAQFPPKLFLNSTFFCNPVCPRSTSSDLSIHLSGIRTRLISTQTILEIQLIPNSSVPNSHHHRFGNSIFSARPSSPMSAQTEYQTHVSLQSGVSPVIPNRLGNSFFWNVDMSHSHPTKIWHSIFLESVVSIFLHNRFGNAPCLECGHAQFPTQFFLKFTLFCNSVCPLSIPTDLAIHGSGIRTCPISTSSDVDILCPEILTCPISTPTDLEIQYFLTFGVPTFLAK